MCEPVVIGFVEVQKGWKNECNRMRMAFVFWGIYLADKVPYNVADDYLLDHGWVKIYRESYCGHKWHVNWKGFLRIMRMTYTPIVENVGMMKHK